MELEEVEKRDSELYAKYDQIKADLKAIEKEIDDFIRVAWSDGYFWDSIKKKWDKEE
jgi:hypothetical protein